MSEKSISTLVKDLLLQLSALLKSEIRLAATELKDNAKNTALKSKTLAICAALLYLGSLAFLSSLIIGIGRILGDSFGWSSLIVGLVLTVPAAIIALNALKKLKEETGMPVTQSELNQDMRMLNRKISEVSESMRSSENQRKAV